MTTKIGFSKDGLVFCINGMDFNKKYVFSECEIDNISFTIPLKKYAAPKGVMSCVGETYRNSDLRISFYVNEQGEIEPFKGESNCYVYKLDNGKFVLTKNTDIEKYISKTKVEEPRFCGTLIPKLRKYKLFGTEHINAEIISYENNGIIFSSEEIESLRSKAKKL